MEIITMFGFFKTKRIGGEIAFYGLQDWWPAKLSKQETDRIIDEHLLWNQVIKTYYRERSSNPEAL